MNTPGLPSVARTNYILCMRTLHSALIIICILISGFTLRSIPLRKHVQHLICSRISSTLIIILFYTSNCIVHVTSLDHNLMKKKCDIYSFLHLSTYGTFDSRRSSYNLTCPSENSHIVRPIADYTRISVSPPINLKIYNGICTVLFSVYFNTCLSHSPLL